MHAGSHTRTLYSPPNKPNWTSTEYVRFTPNAIWGCFDVIVPCELEEIVDIITRASSVYTRVHTSVVRAQTLYAVCSLPYSVKHVKHLLPCSSFLALVGIAEKPNARCWQAFLPGGGSAEPYCKGRTLGLSLNFGWGNRKLKLKLVFGCPWRASRGVRWHIRSVVRNKRTERGLCSAEAEAVATEPVDHLQVLTGQGCAKPAPNRGFFLSHFQSPVLRHQTRPQAATTGSSLPSPGPAAEAGDVSAFLRRGPQFPGL